ncbi:hypothetical protein ACQZ6H_17650 [Agrobacterium fabrum]|uniref:hypothetical protein n=1 Tax=Agrobacterium fabrum TaxID=1176649 RepID=UPI003D655E73
MDAAEGWKQALVKELIAHTHRDEVRSACISVRWLAGRREMLEWWSDYLDNAEAGNKVNLTVVHGEAA